MALGKNKVLGRGLGNLMPGFDKEVEGVDSPPKEIKLSEIKPNPHQPRKSFSQDSLQELSKTIQTHGVIQPIVVRKEEKGYTLVSGERRFRAAELAGFQKIPAIVRNYNEDQMREIALVENLQREDLNPIEEALAYQTLMEKNSLKVTELAERVGKNRTTIYNMIRLLGLPDSVLQMLRNGKMSEGQARPLLSLGEPKKQIELANKIVAEQWPVRQVENYVSQVLHPERKSKELPKPKIKEPTIQKIETKLRNKLSAKLEIQHNEKSGKGKIQIFYSSVEDMERVLENLGIKP